MSGISRVDRAIGVLLVAVLAALAGLGYFQNVRAALPMSAGGLSAQGAGSPRRRLLGPVSSFLAIDHGSGAYHDHDHHRTRPDTRPSDGSR